MPGSTGRLDPAAGGDGSPVCRPPSTAWASARSSGGACSFCATRPRQRPGPAGGPEGRRPRPREGTWILASCHGPEAAWYRALRTRPKTTIQFGNRHYAVTAHFPSAEEGGEILARCAPARPRAARRLCASAGVDIADGGPDPYRRAGRRIPFVRLDAAPGQCVR